jgi:hypothetical protein
MQRPIYKWQWAGSRSPKKTESKFLIRHLDDLKFVVCRQFSPHQTVRAELPPMEKFRGRLALPVARLTRNFPSPTILPEPGGRNRCIQQMAHFVPNRCHTPIGVGVLWVRGFLDGAGHGRLRATGLGDGQGSMEAENKKSC